ncbi:MAG TPA: DHHA1 domain-containing protein [Vicinamibacterales bacterium]|nr:DHHA1 domain-containing protein [Vicinamibacterales bacterium]
MTERLYYTDPYLREFDATIIETIDAGGRPGVVLDRTAFYPTSGGQPFDIGTLHDVKVIDVVDDDEGRIVHVVERAPAAAAVHGRIDWDRRFDHMQQHTGQHVLSAAFDRLFGVRTESFHLGAETCTIDLAREVSVRELDEAEAAANRVVWEDRRVTIRFADANEAATLGLRKASTRAGTLRLIDVEEFDLSACGGTHVARTGAIGIIAVAGTERFRGGTRVTFLCGARALGGYHALRDAVAGSVRVLSVTPAELPAAIERLQSDAREQRRQVKDLGLRLAAFEADALADAAEEIAGHRVVFRAVPDADANVLKLIAGRVASRAGHAAVLVGDAPPLPIVVARASDVGIDAGRLLRAIVERHGGKGGGRPELAQGGGIAAPPQEVLATARELIAGSQG